MNNNQDFIGREADMRIRKAIPEDLSRVSEIYEHIHDREEAGLTAIGWKRKVYPVKDTARLALARDDLFVLEDEGKLIASAIINKVQVPEYALATWKHSADDDEIMVLHTLCIDPAEQGRGYGRAFVSFYEEYALKAGCPELRMDTNAVNKTARAMYRKLGYEEVGIVPCVFNGISGVQLVCLEKHLG